MIDLTTLPEEGLSQTQKNIRQQVINRGWQAHVPYVGSPHYYLTRADGKKLHVFSTMSPRTTYAAASLANDKFAVHSILQGTDVPQLDTVKVTFHDKVRAEAIAFLHEKGRVVVKPIDGGHGKGITINITDEPALHAAIDTAIKHTKSLRAALVQEQYDADVIYDLRILFIDYQYSAALQRVAARVFGDGVHTVGELIDIENTSERRGKPYYAELATIDRELASQYLKDRINNVPEQGQEVQVLGIANYGAGGETLDVTDDLPQWLIAHAETVARACELEVAGVDFMIAKFPRADMTEDELNVAMTEVNKAPLLTMHDSPTTGISRGVMQRYMDYLAAL